MAKRFTDAEKARAVKKVEKARAEGKSLNAACEEVVQKAGWPSVGALTNWVKAAEAAGSTAPAEEVTAPAEEAAAPATRRRVAKKPRKTRAATARKRAVSADGSSPEKNAAPAVDAVAAEATLITETVPAATVDDVAVAAEPSTAEDKTAVALVAVPAAAPAVTAVADPEFGHRTSDDLANEVRRLRMALEELHGENRALKDLVGIYVRR